MSSNIYQSLLGFYQKFISPVFGPSCRYYPSCSEYAKWQFDTNKPHLAFWHSAIRILRCNKLFDGGIDYPKIKFQPPKLMAKNPKNIEIKYWIVSSNGGFEAIKAFK